MSNKTYNTLKYIALIAFPAIIVAVSGIGLLWGIPHTEKIVATLGIVNTLLGALLQVSSSSYAKKGGK